MSALENILVVDLSRVLAGPIVAMTLGDLGALGARVERLDESELEVGAFLGTAEDPTVTLLTATASHH